MSESQDEQDLSDWGLVDRSGVARWMALPLKVGATLIGRGVENDWVLKDEATSRRHLSVSVTELGEVVAEDLGSANGVRINGTVILGPTPLQDGDVVGLGLATQLELTRLSGSSWAQGVEHMRARNLDATLGVWNADFFDDLLDTGIQRKTIIGDPFCLLLARMEGYAELAARSADGRVADVELTCVARIRRHLSFQKGDAVAWLGDGLFGVMLTHNNIRQGLQRAESLRDAQQLMTQNSETSDEIAPPQLAMGLAACRQQVTAPEELMGRAMQALEQAQKDGHGLLRYYYEQGAGIYPKLDGEDPLCCEDSTLRASDAEIKAGQRPVFRKEQFEIE
ncbi:FHA domain-containing protein [Magnetofaba australis]|uniref:Putative diguanylate cyclase n=1 Tax=Magnetofaba australis IT-1 TaxID=1434232 RepID=A0A1Y2K6L9_9PROT|nr:FHA domain-containing protein [Magnetofaba australis]OSM05291.1 putative diguanylate cyclase [Magnetofaba australis IT-1]